MVEEVTPGGDAAKAGLRPGDVLVSWERGANPPSNPAPARGSFRSPFDVDEVRFEQGPRARSLTLALRRDGASVSAPIGQYPWRLQTRPALTGKWLSRYERGRDLQKTGGPSEGLDVWRALARDLAASGRHVDAAWLWSRIGTRLSAAKQPDAALDALANARTEAKAAGRADIEAQLRGSEVDVLRAAGRLEQARAPARQALAARERIAPESLAVAVALYELTTVLSDEVPEYEALSRRALQIRQRLAPGSRVEADALTNLARYAEGQGETRNAVDLQRRALAIHRALDPASPSVARGLSTLCAYQMNGGDLVGAEDSCRRSVQAARALGPTGQALVGQALHNTGVVARLRGEFDRAIQLFNQSMETYEQIDPGGSMVAANHWDIAATEVSRQDIGRLDAAEEHLRRFEQCVAGEPRDEALTALVRADIAHQRKDLAWAEEQLRRALPYFDRLAPDGAVAADIVGCLGIVLTEQNRLAEAEALLRRALASSQRFAPGSQKTAEFQHHLGILLWRAGRTAEAEAALERSLEDLEFQLGRLAASDEGSSSFGAQYADFYKAYLELLIERRREQDAFGILERYRSGAFLRMLAQRELATPEEVPADLSRERELVNAEYERAQAELRQLDPKMDSKRSEAGLARLTELRARQAAVADAIRKASPRYGALRYPRSLDLALARATLERGSLLLSYSIGKERSFLFAVPADPGRGLSVFPLPVGDRTLRESVAAFRRLIDRKKPVAEIATAGRALYDLLIRPAEGLVTSSERLLIVPDGPLHALPWAGLVRGRVGERPEYLAGWKPLATVASVTVYAQLKKGRPDGRRTPAIEMAAFGDPMYSALASRAGVRRGDASEEGNASEEIDEDALDPDWTAVLRAGHTFEPLPNSRDEAEAIARLYAPRSEAYVGEEATETRAVSVGRGVPLIHYACHAYVNEKSPLDSALVFSIPEKPEPGRDNGLLQAWEIIEKVRIDADLVTLSACDTGLGREMGGEGLIGLTRAFQYAGARSVLASLWKVDDAPTAELMKRFYGHLKSGRTKDEALRLAQMDLVRSRRHAPPRDWAGFALIGDWK